MIIYSIRIEGVGGSSPSCGTTKSIKIQSLMDFKAGAGSLVAVKILYNSG